MRTEDESNLAEAVTRLSADVVEWKERAGHWALRAWLMLLAVCALVPAAYYGGLKTAKRDPVGIVCLKEPPPPEPCRDHVEQDHSRMAFTCPHVDHRMTVTPGREDSSYQLIQCLCPRPKP
jgi:hypothetical protein